MALGERPTDRDHVVAAATELLGALGGQGQIAPAEPESRIPTPALVHDYLLVLRGAERTFAAIADLWPSAPIYTLLYDEQGTRGRFAGRTVTTSMLQRLRVRQSGFRRMLPLFPAAAKRIGCAEHELVISSSSAFAHRAPSCDGGVHVNYCHSPFRYLWHERARATEEVPAPLRPVLRHMLDRMRVSDIEAATSVTHVVANSTITRDRIAEYWGRETSVVHPPVQVERFSPGTPEDWFLCVGELVAHKRTEDAIVAARRAGVPLKVVGTGPEHERLAALYGDSVDFVGRIGDRELASLYSRARAFVMPNVEEFGIAAVEAQAAGRPVVAINRGGATETVLDGTTGVLVNDRDGLAEALRDTDFDRFTPDVIIGNAQRFSTRSFQAALGREVVQAWSQR